MIIDAYFKAAVAAMSNGAKTEEDERARWIRVAGKLWDRLMMYYELT